MEFYALIPVYLLLGALVGLLAGLLGIGGGLIMVPALLYIMTTYLSISIELALPMAIATSLSTIILTGLSSALAHYRLGHVRTEIVVYCGVGIAIGAIIGPLIATSIDVNHLKTIFACIVMLIALQMIFVKPKKSEARISNKVLIAIGFLTGIISSFMGIGGGALMVPALVWFRIDIKQAIGCAALCGLIIALFGSASYVIAGWHLLDLPLGAFGYLYLPAAIGIVITSVFTAKYGANLSHKLNTRKLKQLFAGFLILVSVRMLLG